MADLKRGLIRLNPQRAEPPRRRAVLIAGAGMAATGMVEGTAGASTPRRPDQADMPAPRGLGGGFRGNLFKGRLVIIFGPTGEPLGVFLYAAGTTPALGNPPIAWMSNATADPFGNPLPASGIVSLDLATNRFTGINGSIISFSSQAAGTFVQRAAQIFMGDALLTTINPELIIDAPSANGGLPNARLVLFGPSRTGGAPLQQILACLSSTSTPLTGAFFEVQNQAVADSVYIAATRVPAGAAPSGVETWHAMTLLLNGWANTAGNVACQYRMVASPPRSVELIGLPLATAATAATFFQLPAGYRPVSQQSFAAGATGGAPANQVPFVQCDTSGNLSVQHATLGAADSYPFHGLISLDA